MRQIINESDFSVSWMKKYKREIKSCKGKKHNGKMWRVGMGVDNHANRGYFRGCSQSGIEELKLGRGRAKIYPDTRLSTQN